MVFVPKEDGVYVKVAVEVLVNVTFVGDKDPPAPLSFGVTITDQAIDPLEPTVKLVEETPIVPTLGPERVTVVEGGNTAAE